MKRWNPIRLVGALLAAGGVLGIRTAEAVLITNSWSSTSSFASKWETPGNWDHGAPSITHAAILITNASQFGSKMILVDANTAASAPLTMDVSNLVLSAPGAAVNVLSLANSGAVLPLRMENLFAIHSGGFLSMTNSAIIVIGLTTNNPCIIDNTAEVYSGASLTSVNRTNEAKDFGIGVGVYQSGILRVAGGTVVIGGRSGLSIGAFRGSSGEVWLTAGEIICTNLPKSGSFGFNGSYVGDQGVGVLVQSNGTMRTVDETVGFHAGGLGTFTLAGGTHITGDLDIGFNQNSTGCVWVTGGQLVITNGGVSIGGVGIGSLVQSNGIVNADHIESVDGGTLTMAGGTNTADFFQIGGGSDRTGTVWVTGGRLLVTGYFSGVLSGPGSLIQSNGLVEMFREFVGLSGQGSLTVAGGTHIVGPQGLAVGFLAGSEGIVKVSGGTSSVHSNMTIGDCPSNAVGTVYVQGGSLFVTNATHDAPLDIRNGWILLTAGQLTVDKLVVTNECGHIFHGGGILSFGSLQLDPNFDADEDGLPNGWEQTYGFDPLETTGNDGGNGDPDGDGFSNYEEYLSGTDPTDHNSSPFRITAAATEGNSIRLTWITGGGLTNFVQATNGAAGDYSNNFVDIAGPIVVPGFGLVNTNYVDTGGATNKPARYYRVRLVP